MVNVTHILVALVFAGPVMAAAAPPATKPATAPAPSFPYAGEVAENDVPVRSGPGTNYYISGTLKRGNKLTVVGSQFSWSRIVPPPGSFSWISMRNVSIDPDNPNIGIVTADGIRVYAGSPFKEPIHSETLQLKLNRSDEVRFIGPPKGDYYKIAPPAGAYLWISTKNIKPAPVKLVKPTVVPPPRKTDPNTATKTVPKVVVKPTVPVTTTISGESENLKAFYALEKLIKAEQTKPADQQNYEDLKKALSIIAANKDAGKAARYAEFALRQINGFELALNVGKVVQLQNEELKKTQEGIDTARATRLAQVPNLGKFAVIGTLQTSNIYGPEAKIKYFRIMDNNKTMCYALPTGPAAAMDLTKLVDSKVGLVGAIEANPQTAGAVVHFTDITEVN